MKLLTSTLLLIALASNLALCQTTYINKENKRSDTIDILHIEVHLEITDFGNKVIGGRALVRFTPRMNNVSTINLDLLSMTIDSIVGTGSISYTYNDTLLEVNLGATYSPTDTVSVTVFYHGKPEVDASGFGGFIFQNGVAYNLGIAFVDKPHNAGRYWFPCFDNFVERSTYLFTIITTDDKMATANGALINDAPLPGNKHLWIWAMDEPIPSYLAMTAVGNFKTVKQNYNGLGGVTPIRLYAKAGDTNKVKSSFVHLNNALNAFEMAFGEYRFNKIGYTFVPFTGGAMEHASNITYPSSFATGNTNFETLMAHELSHQWWGNFVTCETPEDMWLNEGMASFCEILFLEETYGWPTAQDEMKGVLLNVLKRAHIDEGGYLAISGVPHDLTYGTHVYDKGSLVAQNLREFLGYNNFYQATSTFLNDRAFNSMNSEQFRDSLTSYTNKNTFNFFEEWVFAGGFPDYIIDSVKVIPVNNEFEVTVYIQQKLNHAPAYYHALPIEIAFYQANMQAVEVYATVDGQYSTIQKTLSFNPVMTSLNPNNRLNYASTDDKKILSHTGLNNLSNAMMKVTVHSITDSTLLKVTHHWAAPDPLKQWATKPYRLSGTRFWEVQGIISQGFDASAQIIYDGRPSGGYLDSSLVGITEDSLILLYRPDASADWEIYPDYAKNDLGNSGNAFGLMEISKLLPGQYTLANMDHTVLSTGALEGLNNKLKIYPNPAGEMLNVLMPANNSSQKLEVFDIQGNLVMLFENLKDRRLHLETLALDNGTYLIKVTGSGHTYSGRFVVLN